MRYAHQKGQALVEMAFVLFILVLLVFGVTEFGRAMYTKNSLNNAARAGVRAAVVNPTLGNASIPSLPQIDRTCSGIDPNDTIQQNICSSIFYIQDMQNVKYTVSAVDTGGNPVTSAASGHTVKVIVQYTNFQSIVPNLVPITNVLTGEAAMRYE